MKKSKLLLFLLIPILNFSQSIIGNMNSGAISSSTFSHSVGEIYVIPTDENQTNSGTMGMLYQTVLQVLGINEIEKEQVKIYPNPTTDFIFFKLNSKTKLETVEIYDLSGKSVAQKNISEEKLDLRFLQQGIYILKFKNSDIQPIKIIKKP